MCHVSKVSICTLCKPFFPLFRPCCCAKAQFWLRMKLKLPFRSTQQNEEAKKRTINAKIKIPSEQLKNLFADTQITVGKPNGRLSRCGGDKCSVNGISVAFLRKFCAVGVFLVACGLIRSNIWVKIRRKSVPIFASKSILFWLKREFPFESCSEKYGVNSKWIKIQHRII